MTEDSCLKAIEVWLARLEEGQRRLAVEFGRVSAVGGAWRVEYDPAVTEACKALAGLWGMAPDALVWKPKDGTHWMPGGYEAAPRQEIPAHALMAPAVVAVLKALREADTGLLDQGNAWYRMIDHLIAVAGGGVRDG